MARNTKQHLLNNIEKLRQELNCLASQESNKLAKNKVLKKSQELDRLLNKYNSSTEY
ncbi:aspartyl-phosphate phosphatase Spo0E family protein [Natronospora cellulosivora (SeqCode)]